MGGRLVCAVGACLQHASLVQDEELFAQLRGTADGSTERAALLRRLVGPTWRDQFGDDAFMDQYEPWNRASFDAGPRRHLQFLTEEPERVSLAALIRAWQAGLTKVVIIPCLDTYTRVIGRHALLMTAETRNDPQRYSEALKQFR